MKEISSDSRTSRLDQMPVPADLVSLLVNRAHELSSKNAFIYLEGLRLTEKPMTYAGLDERARAIAADLQKRLAPGDRALLVYDCDMDYIAGFFGCLYAGVVAVPVYIPTSAKHLPRMQKIIDDCQAKLILTTTAIAKLLALLPQKGFSQVVFMTTDDVPSEMARSWDRPPISPESLAFLQYTSGSTGDPKGVMLTHRNLIANMVMAREAFEMHDENEVQVSWLPLYHDLGLIGGILATLYNRRTTVLMHPMSIVRPISWLKTIQKYKASATAAPNFAFELCMQRISDEEAAQLDLSSVKIFMSGAEPVRTETLNGFYEKFKVAGLRRESLCPAYGLAEATLLVTTKRTLQPFKTVHVDKESLAQGRVNISEQPRANTQTFAGCGRAAGDQIVKIFDSETRKSMPDFAVGEIWTSGRHVAQGYWQKPEISGETFVEHDGRRWLRTGDLGFMDEDGELFIVGRSKDIIILMGKKYAPQDIEDAAKRAHPQIAFSVNAAFSREKNGQEQVVLVQEVPAGTSDAQLKEIEKACREAVTAEQGLELGRVHFVEAQMVPRTSSGKIRRRETKNLFLKRKLKPYRESILTSARFVKLKKKARKKTAEAYLMWRNSRLVVLAVVGLAAAYFSSRK